MFTLQEIIQNLSSFWARHGCLVITPYDLEKGAGTSNPETLLRALGPEPYSAAYIEPCRRPKDGRYGENPNRVQHYFQFQVILKPSPDNIVDLYLASLDAIGLNRSLHDIRFVHDDWENPTLGAWGLGWEIWIDGMESSQFTYFQAAAGLSLPSISGEITYGLERLAMCIQGVDSIYDIQWNEKITWGDLYREGEVQWSRYNFEAQDDRMWMRHFEDFKAEALRLVSLQLPLPAYDFVVKASHAFNMLDAKGVISVSERASYISMIRDLAKAVAESYLKNREQLGFPLLKPIVATTSLAELPPIPKPQASNARFVLEIGCEELPAAFLPNGIQTLLAAVKRILDKENLSYSNLKAYGAPRRLAVVVDDLMTTKPTTSVEKRGPLVDLMWKNGLLTEIGAGFLKSVQIPPCSLQDVENGLVSHLEIKSIKQQRYVFATVSTPERSTAQLLATSLPGLISSLEFPKSMRWGDHSLQFARPIRWILALLGTDIIPFQVEFIQSGRTSFGHRQLYPKPISISSADTFEHDLENGFVLIDQEARRHRIHSDLQKLLQLFSVSAVHIEKVIGQVLHLTEWPHVTDTCFDKKLLDAPKEVLISEMVEHQKYFPLIEADGHLSNRFIIVTDNTPSDLIKRGNVKVLTARLADGSFLWKEDCKLPLHSLREKLSTIIYQRELGTVWQKTQRLELLSRSLHAFIPTANLEDTLEAARLSKADLASQVVGEFPELQGTVGGLLALEQRFSPAVANAIKDHWLPNQEEGPLPYTDEAALLALADKFDTLAGFFAIGRKPTSSSDPYALRRQAIGIMRILLERRIHLSLHSFFAKTLILFQNPIADRTATISELVAFMATRAKSHFADLGFRKEAIEAVFTAQSDDLYDAFLRLKALTELQQSHAAFASFAEVIKRCHGQVELSYTGSIQENRLEDEAEKQLYTALIRIEKETRQYAEQHTWKGFLTSLLDLREPIDALFTKVKVLADDPVLRSNRLSLLHRVITLTDSFADVKRLSL